METVLIHNLPTLRTVPSQSVYHKCLITKNEGQVLTNRKEVSAQTGRRGVGSEMGETNGVGGAVLFNHDPYRVGETDWRMRHIARQ